MTKAEKDPHRYDDMLFMTHKSIPPRGQKAADRAAQFSPFAALSGYGDIISETARQTDAGMFLEEDHLEELDRVIAAAEKGGLMKVKYFVPDEKKDGGSFCTLQGRIEKLDAQRGGILFENGSFVAFKDISDMELLP